jgi:hypothetical protein
MFETSKSYRGAWLPKRSTATALGTHQSSADKLVDCLAEADPGLASKLLDGGGYVVVERYGRSHAAYPTS